MIISQGFPEFTSFSRISGDNSLFIVFSSISILSSYPSPKTVLDAPKDDILDILITKSRKGLLWAEKVYSKLYSVTNDAVVIGLPLPGLSIKITSNLTLLNALESEIQNLMSEINNLIKSNDFPKQIRTNIELLKSIPGIGELTAITLVAEIGDINGFIKPKHLVAFFGIDSSVNESGNFKGNQNKISKRGTRIGRRALYAVALASIRQTRKGVPVNKILLDYYDTNLNGKKPKVALVAIMHKILNYIFAVLRNQSPFELRDPRIHKQMFLDNKATANVA